MNALILSERRLAVCSWLAILILGVMVIVGAAAILSGHEEFRGNFAFAIIVIAALANIATLLSYGAHLQIQKVSQMGWVATGCICLGFSVYLVTLDHPDAHKAADTVLLVAMFVLAFPSGILALGLAMIYSSQFLASHGAGTLDLFIFWLPFFGLGYFQWFKLIPFLIGKLRVRRMVNSDSV